MLFAVMLWCEGHSPVVPNRGSGSVVCMPTPEPGMSASDRWHAVVTACINPAWSARRQSH